MRRHLDDERLARAIAGDPLDTETRRHLAECLVCRRTVTALRGHVEAGLRRMEAEAPDWDGQLERILERVERPGARTRPHRTARVAVAAAALAAVTALAALVATHGGPARRTDRDAAIERVLAEVNATLDGDPLQGFAPLEALVPGPEELERYGRPAS